MTRRVKLWDKYFDLFLDEEQIAQRVQELAKELHKDYLGKRPIFVAVLNGSIHFASDLTRNFHDKCDLWPTCYSGRRHCRYRINGRGNIRGVGNA